MQFEQTGCKDASVCVCVCVCVCVHACMYVCVPVCVQVLHWKKWYTEEYIIIIRKPRNIWNCIHNIHPTWSLKTDMIPWDKYLCMHDQLVHRPGEAWVTCESQGPQLSSSFPCQQRPTRHVAMWCGNLLWRERAAHRGRSPRCKGGLKPLSSASQTPRLAQQLLCQSEPLCFNTAPTQEQQRLNSPTLKNITSIIPPPPGPLPLQNSTMTLKMC